MGQRASLPAEVWLDEFREFADFHSDCLGRWIRQDMLTQAAGLILGELSADQKTVTEQTKVPRIFSLLSVPTTTERTTAAKPVAVKTPQPDSEGYRIWSALRRVDTYKHEKVSLLGDSVLTEKDYATTYAVEPYAIPPGATDEDRVEMAGVQLSASVSEPETSETIQRFEQYLVGFAEGAGVLLPSFDDLHPLAHLGQIDFRDE